MVLASRPNAGFDNAGDAGGGNQGNGNGARNRIRHAIHNWDDIAPPTDYFQMVVKKLRKQAQQISTSVDVPFEQALAAAATCALNNGHFEGFEESMEDVNNDEVMSSVHHSCLLADNQVWVPVLVNATRVNAIPPRNGGSVLPWLQAVILAVMACFTTGDKWHINHGGDGSIKEHALKALLHVLMDVDSHGNHCDEDEENAGDAGVPPDGATNGASNGASSVAGEGGDNVAMEVGDEPDSDDDENGGGNDENGHAAGAQGGCWDARWAHQQVNKSMVSQQSAMESFTMKCRFRFVRFIHECRAVGLTCSVVTSGNGR